MDDALNDPIELYRARDLTEAYAIRVRLLSEGITVRIENELLQGALGDLPMGWATAPRIVVERAHDSRAREVLEQFSREAEKNKARDISQLRCLACDKPMGSGAACPSCGWSYKSGSEDTSEPDAEINAETEPHAVGVKNEPLRPQDAGVVPAITRPAMWGELFAVLASSFIPSLVGVATGYYSTVNQQPYWLDSVQATIFSICIIFVTLYLMHRSGEKWEHFGITRPSGLAVPGGLLMFLAAYALRDVQWAVLPNLAYVNYPFPLPHGGVDVALMIAKYAVLTFSEELIYRAYLITRLSTLLRSRGKAVLVAAILFALVHAYQGQAGVIYALLFALTFGVAFLMIRRVWPLAFGHALYDIYIELLLANG